MCRHKYNSNAKGNNEYFETISIKPINITKYTNSVYLEPCMKR